MSALLETASEMAAADALMANVTKQLRYEINALESLMWNGVHHPSYAPQAMIRQQGHALKGAVSLAVRLGGSVHRSLSNEVRDLAATTADRAINFKKA
jgi:hypothetical protein